MIAFPGLLVQPAKDAGITVPDSYELYDQEQFPHWHLYLVTQIGAAMPHSNAHWDNAKVIAALSLDQVHNITMRGLIEAGLAV